MIKPSVAGVHAAAHPDALSQEAEALALNTACGHSTCSHSISRRLSRKLALFTIAVLGLLSWASWMSVEMMFKQRNAQDLQARAELVADILALEARSGGEPAVLARLQSDAPMRANARLQVWRADGSLLYGDRSTPQLAASTHTRVHELRVDVPTLPGGPLLARYTCDYTADAQMGQRWAWILVAVTLLTGGVVAIGASWHVRHSLRPLRDLAAQTLAISPQQLERRLSLDDPAEELKPWVEQFNALMGRLEQAYSQLEGFNADVA
ncbi:MAG TPA: hypothetical protein VK439_10730, partial [Rubrivivax sp.]|nr:hypothetical protein [Rubrivivax sp.]